MSSPSGVAQVSADLATRDLSSEEARAQRAEMRDVEPLHDQ